MGAANAILASLAITAVLNHAVVVVTMVRVRAIMSARIIATAPQDTAGNTVNMPIVFPTALEQALEQSAHAIVDTWGVHYGMMAFKSTSGSAHEAHG